MASPVALAGWLGSTLGTTAYHVRTLERLGLIELVAESRVRARSSTITARGAPERSDEAWAAAPAIAKQAAVSASLETIDAYAQAASEAGGFDDGDAHLARAACTSTPAASRTSPKPACGSSPSSTASRRPSTERIELNCHSGETQDVALVMMLFEAARGAQRSSEAADQSGVEKRRPAPLTR